MAQPGRGETDIFFLGAPTGIGAPRVKVPKKWPQTRVSCRQRAPTDKGPLYRQRAPTVKELIHTRGSYRQTLYRRCVIPTHLRSLETYRQGALVDALQFLQTNGPYRHTDKERAPTDQ